MRTSRPVTPYCPTPFLDNLFHCRTVREFQGIISLQIFAYAYAHARDWALISEIVVNMPELATADVMGESDKISSGQSLNLRRP